VSDDLFPGVDVEKHARKEMLYVPGADTSDALRALSDADLTALSAGDVTRLSDDGLRTLSNPAAAAARAGTVGMGFGPSSDAPYVTELTPERAAAIATEEDLNAMHMADLNAWGERNAGRQYMETPPQYPPNFVGPRQVPREMPPPRPTREEYGRRYVEAEAARKANEAAQRWEAQGPGLRVAHRLVESPLEAIEHGASQFVHGDTAGERFVGGVGALIGFHPLMAGLTASRASLAQAKEEAAREGMDASTPVADFSNAVIDKPIEWSGDIGRGAGELASIAAGGSEDEIARAGRSGAGFGQGILPMVAFGPLERGAANLQGRSARLVESLAARPRAAMVPLAEAPAPIPAAEVAPLPTRIPAPAPVEAPARVIQPPKPRDVAPSVNVETGAPGGPRVEFKEPPIQVEPSAAPAAPPTRTAAPEAAPVRRPIEAEAQLPEEVLKMGKAWGRPAPSEGTVPTAGEQQLADFTIESLAQRASAETGRDIRPYKASDGAEFLFDNAQVKRGFLSYLDRPKKGRTPWRLINGTDEKPPEGAAREVVQVRDSSGREVRTVLARTPEEAAAAEAAQPEGLKVERKPATDETLRKTLEERAAPPPEEPPAEEPSVEQHPAAQELLKRAAAFDTQAIEARSDAKGEETIDSRFKTELANAMRRVAAGEDPAAVRADLEKLPDTHTRASDGKVTWRAGEQAPIYFDHAMKVAIARHAKAVGPMPKEVKPEDSEPGKRTLSDFHGAEGRLGWRVYLEDGTFADFKHKTDAQQAMKLRGIDAVKSAADADFGGAKKPRKASPPVRGTKPPAPEPKPPVRETEPPKREPVAGEREPHPQAKRLERRAKQAFEELERMKRQAEKEPDLRERHENLALEHGLVAQGLRRVAAGERVEDVAAEIRKSGSRPSSYDTKRTIQELAAQAIEAHVRDVERKATKPPKPKGEKPPKPKKELPTEPTKPDRYFVATNEGKFREVPGKAPPGPQKWAREHNLFITKESDGWTVSEARSGAGVGHGKTAAAAWEMAKKNIERVGVDEFNKMVRKYSKKGGVSPRFTDAEHPLEVEVSASKYRRATGVDMKPTGPRTYDALVLDEGKWRPVEFDVANEKMLEMEKQGIDVQRDYLRDQARIAYDIKKTEAAGEGPATAAGRPASLFAEEEAAAPPAAPSPGRRQVKPGTPGEIVRESEIVQKLEDTIDRPIRVGRLGAKTRSVLGFYRLREEVVRLKHANDTSTSAHEAGHALEAQLLGGDVKNANVPKPVLKDLYRLGKLLYGRRRPATSYEAEGFAELLRERVEHKGATKNALPATRAWLETVLDQAPEVKKGIERAAEMAQRYEDQGPEGRFEAFQHTGKPSLVSRIAAAVSEWRRNPGDQLAKLNRWWLDDLDTLKRFAEASGHPEIIEMARQYTRSASSRAKEFLDKGDLATDMGGGPGLREIVRPVVDAGKMREFRAVVVARRALDYFKSGLDPGLRKEDVEYVLRNFDNGVVADAATKRVEWRERLMYDTMVRRGGVSRRVYERLREDFHNENYAHFMRMFPEVKGDIRALVEEGGRKGSAIEGTPEPVRRRTGSTREIRDVLEADVADVGRLISLGDRLQLSNAIARAGDSAQGLGKWIEEVPKEKMRATFQAWQIRDFLEGLKGGKLTKAERSEALTVFVNRPQPKGNDNIVTLWKNGKRKWYQVSPEMREALSRLDSRETGAVLRTLGLFSKAQRLGAVVYSVGFQVANPIRDIPMYLLTGVRRKVPVYTAAKNLVRGFAHSLAMPSSVESRMYKASGAESGGYWGYDRDFTADVVKQMSKKTPLTAAEKAARVIDPTNWGHGIREFASRVEGGTRMAEFLTVLENEGWTPKKGPASEALIRKAALAAENVTVDFKRMGEFGAKMNVATAFFNPSIQAIDKVARAMGNPRTHARGVVYITAPTVALWASTKDDERVYGRPGYMRYGYWLVPFGSGPNDMIRIPMPHAVGSIYAGLPLAVLDYMNGKNPQAFSEWGTQMYQTTVPPLVPTAAQGAIDVFRNKQSFSGRPVVPPSLEEAPLEQQYGEGTSRLAREVAPKLGLSPLAFDYLFNYYTGGAYREVVDTGEAAVGVRPREASGRVPIVSRFTVSGIESKDYDRFWQLRSELDKMKAEEQLVRRAPERARAGGVPHVPSEASEAVSEIARAMQSTRRQYFRSSGEEKDRLGEQFLEQAREARELVERILATSKGGAAR